MSKFLLRVDDCGWQPADKSNDVKLSYFKNWFAALNPQHSPVYLGFIPTTVTATELSELAGMLRGQFVSIHGHNHTYKSMVLPKQMQAAIATFGSYNMRTASYIPPFNDYDERTIEDWGLATKQQGITNPVFFGGFSQYDPGMHHDMGELPRLIQTQAQPVLHIPAIRAIYGRAPELLNSLPDWPDSPVPQVVTLHATWDVNHLSYLGPLMDYLRPRLISASEVFAWVQQTNYSVKELTGAHYTAMNCVCQHVQRSGLQVMDFGARYGKLPAHLALRGCKVLAVDRDPDLAKYQAEHAKNYGVQIETRNWDGFAAFPGEEQFDMISACWAIQHNLEPGQIEQISRNLWDRLKPGGRLVIIGSRSIDDTRTDTTRSDPQVILNDADFNQRVIQAVDWRLDEQVLFRYEHGQTNVQYPASPTVANAAYYSLLKPN